MPFKPLKQEKPTKSEADELIRRALAGWYRFQKDASAAVTAKIVMHDDRIFIVLRSKGEIVGVYRCRPNGSLTLMSRPPEEVLKA